MYCEKLKKSIEKTLRKARPFVVDGHKHAGVFDPTGKAVVIDKVFVPHDEWSSKATIKKGFEMDKEITDVPYKYAYLMLYEMQELAKALEDVADIPDSFYETIRLAEGK